MKLLVTLAVTLCLAVLTCGQLLLGPTQPPAGQRCSGRNFNGRRCCTPANPCDLGEGDCDGPLDGGVNDGHAGCKGDLVCGSNNCKKFGLYFHEKDDCCDLPSSIPTERPPPVLISGVPLEPPAGQIAKHSQSSFTNYIQVSGVGVVTLMVKDAALLMNPVEKERETVMEQEMEDLMMGTEDVVGTLYAAVTTANSLAPTTTRRTTVVRDQQPN